MTIAHTARVTPPMGADPEPLDPAFLQSFCAQRHAAWNAQDYEHVTAMCTDDVESRDPTLPEAEFGRRPVTTIMAMVARACADYRFEETEPAYASQTRTEATVPWRCTGTVTGSLVPPGFATTGNSIQLHGDEHWEFRGGLLCRWLAVERCLPTAWRGADLTR